MIMFKKCPRMQVLLLLLVTEFFYVPLYTKQVILETPFPANFLAVFP